MRRRDHRLSLNEEKDHRLSLNEETGSQALPKGGVWITGCPLGKKLDQGSPLKEETGAIMEKRMCPNSVPSVAYLG